MSKEIKYKIGIESSFVHEDKDKEYPENLVAVIDYGGDEGTETIGTFDCSSLKSLEVQLSDFVESVNKLFVPYKVDNGVESEIYSKDMSVQQMIDELDKVEDKSVHIELCDVEGDRYLPMGVDILHDGEDQHERNVDINFSTRGYNK